MQIGHRDTDTCPDIFDPNFVPKELQTIACRTEHQWKKHLDNVADDTSVNQFTIIDIEQQMEDLVIGTNHLKTYRQKAINQNSIKGLVILFHGLNSRVGHGAHIAKYLAQNNYEVVGFDYRGLGTSQKSSTTHELNLKTHLSDCQTFIDLMFGKQKYKGLKKFALGLSLGGLTSFHKASNFSAVILMAPAIQKIQQLPSNIKDYHRLVTANIQGRDLLNHDPNKFVSKTGSPIDQHYIALLLSAMKVGPQNYNHFNTPFMVVNGGSDRLVDPRVGFDLINTTDIKQKAFYFQDDMWHNVWFDRRIISEIMPQVLKFIESIK